MWMVKWNGACMLLMRKEDSPREYRQYNNTNEFLENIVHPWLLFIEKIWGIIELVFSVNKRLFRAPLGLWPTPHSDSAQIWVSNRLDRWTRSGWKADQDHKCVILRCEGFLHPQSCIDHLCAFSELFDCLTCTRFLCLLSTCWFSNELYSFVPFGNAFLKPCVN